MPLLNERGYQPFEFTSVMYRPIAVSREVSRPGPSVRRLGEDEHELLYARVASEGWRDSGFADFMLEIGRVSANTAGLHLFVAELDGTAIAAGAVHLGDGVAHLAGASTIPAGRQRGAQLALLDHGCSMAARMAATRPDGRAARQRTQRNAERQGFRLAYTRIKWKQ